MKIAHVISYFQPQLGYQEFYLAKEQQKMGHEIYVVTSDRHSQSAELRFDLKDRVMGSGIFLEEDLTVYRLPSIFEVGPCCLVKGMKRLLKWLRPEIIHAHEIYTITPALPAFFKNSIGYKYLIDTHVAYPMPSLRKISFLILKKIVYNLAVNKADKVVAVESVCRDWFCDQFIFPRDDVAVVPLGADSELFQPNSDFRSYTRRKLGLSDNDILVIYAGKVAYTKDIHILLHALGQLSTEYENVNLLLLGTSDSVYLELLRRIAQRYKILDRVFFYGFVPRQELPQYYNGGDIAVFPGSRSITIFEAMSTALPIIVSQYFPSEDYPYAHNARQYLEHENGLSFTRGNIQELASCLETLICNSGLRFQMGLKSRKLIEEKYNWKMIASKFEAIYNSILNSK